MDEEMNFFLQKSDFGQLPKKKKKLVTSGSMPRRKAILEKTISTSRKN